MSEGREQDRIAEEAAEAVRAGDHRKAADLFLELAEAEGVPEVHRVEAARAIFRSSGGAETLHVVEDLLFTVEPGHPDHEEAVRLWAEVLEEKGGRGTRDAIERAQAHMRAACLRPRADDPRHLKALFRALVRVAELEGSIPRLDPRIPGAESLERALEAHRRWRQGGSAADAAGAYSTALGAEVPDPVRPYLLYWLGHLQGVDGRIEEAIETFRRLLEMGPPGSGGRRDVEARIEHLRGRLQDRDPVRVREQVEELRRQGRPRDAVEVLETAIHRCHEDRDELELRRLLARTLTVLGERELARGEWERVSGLDERLGAGGGGDRDTGEDGEGARPAADAGEEPPEEARGEEPSPERGRSEGSRTTTAVVARGTRETSARARHQAELARRLDAAGQVREAVYALRRSYLELPRGHEQDRMRKRAAAMAWHRLGEPVLAMEALAGLSEEVRGAPDTRRLETDLREGVVDRLRREIDLGLRTVAFESLADLHRALDPSEALRDELFQLYLDELSSCVYRRWRLRRREVADELSAYRERGFGAWSLVRLPSGASGSPRHLAALREEEEVLERFGRALTAREREVVQGRDLDGHAARLEDRDGLMAMEAMLVFGREVAERRAEQGAENPVSDWRDKLLSWLPGGARELLVSRESLSVDSALDDLMGQFEAFLDLRFGPRPA